MATIDLNNLIQPKKVNSPNTLNSKQVTTISPIYKDLHLDLSFSSNVGLGDKPAQGGDISVDTDIQAVKNSIRNLFTTMKGQKVLDPNFGCSLESFLFEPVSELGAQAIGNLIYDGITQYEPRITVLQVYVVPNQNNSPSYNLDGSQLSVFVRNNNTISKNPTASYGEGYAISVFYQFKDLPNKDVITILAQMGGQVIV